MHDTATEAEELAEFRTKVAAMEAAVAAVVLGARRLVRAGVAERVEGRPLDLLLAADVGMPGVDRYHLLNAADVLQSMPQIADSWAGGRLSWGQVRSICAAVRKRSLKERAVVDARVTACLADRAGDEDSTVRLDAHDPDALLDGVDLLLDELRSRRSVEQAEARNQRRRSFALQPRLDGGVDGRFSYSDPEAASVIGEAIAAHATDPRRTTRHGHRTSRHPISSPRPRRSWGCAATAWPAGGPTARAGRHARRWSSTWTSRTSSGPSQARCGCGCAEGPAASPHSSWRASPLKAPTCASCSPATAGRLPSPLPHAPTGSMNTVSRSPTRSSPSPTSPAAPAGPASPGCSPRSTPR